MPTKYIIQGGELIKKINYKNGICKILLSNEGIPLGELKHANVYKDGMGRNFYQIITLGNIKDVELKKRIMREFPY